jgi:hypothetical protein
MAKIPQSYGLTILGSCEPEQIFASARRPRQFDITVAQGSKLKRGTLMQKKSDAETYEIWDGSQDMAGVLGNDVDATNGDINTFLMFDCDLLDIGIEAATTIVTGFDRNSLINIMSEQQEGEGE